MALSFRFLTRHSIPNSLTQLGSSCLFRRQRDFLVAGRDLSRQDAEFVDVPITYEHLDRGQHFLTAAPPLGMTSLLG
jgi:hypothetical protein